MNAATGVTTMTAYDLMTIILTLEGILYILIGGIVLKRRGFQEQVVRCLVLYALVSCLWALGQTFGRLGWLPFVADDVLVRMPVYGVLLLSWLFLHLTLSFLRLERHKWGWWVLGAAWIMLVIVLEVNQVNLPELLESGDGWVLHRQDLILSARILGWAIFMGGAALLTVRTYRQTQQPLHRNRITYWPPALGFTVAGDVLFFAGHEVLGGGLRLVAILIATYVVVTHQLPDVRQAARRTVSYLIITLLAVVLYTSGLVAMQYAFQAAPGYSPLLAGAAMALILAILFQPLLSLVQRLVSRLISGASFDPSHTLREYSTSISNILDLELLANVMVNLIAEAIGIRRGRLFLVDHEEEESGDGSFRLRDAGGMGDKETKPETLAADSPIVEYLRQERRLLTQYDIDLLSQFQEIPSGERAWLSSLDVDVYVPIHGKGDWIGLLALGPKVSGDRYFEADLALLGMLADQTAVALENARLVEDLISTNDDLGQAYAALDQANRQLQELDKLKSAFIGVITHELRTPFANVVFSLEVLERYGQEHLPPELSQQLQQLADGIKAARIMVDNLVNFATFLSKQGELRLAQMDFGQVTQDSLLPLKPLAETKGLTLHIEVPESLPPLSGDRERLGDAVYHLVHNAIKFTGAGGDVWIRCQAADDTIRFEVQDTGRGVPAHKLATLWDGFTQMADPLRRGMEGLGLGLALVKYVVNAHGGEVLAESQEGVGSTFGFQIPLHARSA
jgi:signal transduction histidine kinase